MCNSAKQFHPLIPAPDLPEGRAAFMLSGGAKAVVEAANRHSSWQGIALVPISALSIACAFFILGWDGALTCSLTVLISLAVFSLSLDSLNCQERAGKKFESLEKVSQFLSQQNLISKREAQLELSNSRIQLREKILLATERVIAGLSGLVHVALSTRVLPTPLPLR